LSPRSLQTAILLVLSHGYPLLLNNPPTFLSKPLTLNPGIIPLVWENSLPQVHPLQNYRRQNHYHSQPTIAIRVSTLLFTVIYSSTLFLLTTAPEEITAGLESLMRPLRRIGVPVTEITLTLTLSLRFIPLVLEEVQNLVRSVYTRAINWKKLGIRKSLQVWLMVAERLLENLLLRAEQIASAMLVRGFTSPNEHRVQWHQLRLRWGDWVALFSLLVFWGLRVVWGGMV